METPLQSVAQLRHAAANLQQLVGELAASLWEKATDQERNLPTSQLPTTDAEPLPVVAGEDQENTHYTPAYVNAILTSTLVTTLNSLKYTNSAQ